jgi:mRNA interferase RelE/StbE
MEVVYLNSYLRSIKKIKNKDLIIKLNMTIENIEKAKTLTEIENIKKLSGFTNCYRIKIDNYRIGIVLKDTIVVLVQFQNRKDIYNKFP